MKIIRERIITEEIISEKIVANMMTEYFSSPEKREKMFSFFQ